MPGIWELREAIAGLYNRLYRRGHAVAVQRRERQRVGRRARGAHARGGQPRAREPRALPARLHRVRRAARHLQGVHRRSRSCSRASAATRSRSTICAARCTGAACRRCCCRTRATRPASSSRATSWPAGSALARELDCALLIDEFYSHYIWTGRPRAAAGRERRALRRGRQPRSGGPLRRPDQELALPGLARDLDRRSASSVIEAVASAGSFLDGGGSKPLQRAAIPLLDDAHVIAETNAIQRGLPREARPPARRARAPGRRAPTAPPDGHVLRLGQGRRAAAAARRRHGLLPRRARRRR